MYPKLLHIYGPIEINSFNAALMAGMAIALYGVLRHPGRENFVSSNDLINISIETAIAGILGGRFLHVVSQWHLYSSWIEMLSIWNGGLSILGAVMTGLGYAFWTLKRKNVPIAPLMDIAAIYIPLIHAIGRIGCFLVGCCYGCETSLLWGITYNHPLVVAPLHIKIHPTQLYSSGVYLLLFLFMRYYIAPRLDAQGTKRLAQGSSMLIYVMGLSLERFFIDFLRGDRVMGVGAFSALSFQQWVALGLLTLATIGLVAIRTKGEMYEPLR